MDNINQDKSEVSARLQAELAQFKKEQPAEYLKLLKTLNKAIEDLAEGIKSK